MSVIFLAGVHGVGKGFLGAAVSSTVGITHFTASQLICEEKRLATWGVDKKTYNLDDNQLSLMRALGQRRLNHKNILLDGHFVLRDAQGVLNPLETTVFKAMNLTGVILLAEGASVIASRLALRDKVIPDLQGISELAEAELAHAQIVCKELGLPLAEIHTPTLASLEVAVRIWLE
ncbi:MAG: ATP-binding protein [Polynucleobacter sp.]|uniref:ATP-binding protein n=1 Tax=Polynucleobacter sp. TaxID=2029855 RepID=UPI002717C54F|nr:ATP-binding protein [Polynucleobacter sp.]MDO8713698.1 ATP-binding protein [Polynucleobacter sp.]